jgi:two-component system, LuxR family, sensor kinase FixL
MPPLIGGSRGLKVVEEWMDACKNEIKELSLLQRAVENTNEAFVTIDQNHRVLFFNRAAERIFGFTREEVIGHDLDIIMSPTCSREHRRAVERFVTTRQPKRIGHATELLATRKNGDTFPANISFSVAEVDGTMYFTGIVTDLTETKALQERIIRSERLAALGKMVAEINHEIKNPLMMIGAFAAQLSRKIKDGQSLEKLSIIVKEVARLEDLLKELKELYLPRSLIMEEISVIPLLQEVHDLIENDCDTKKISVNLKMEGDRPFIKGDRSRLKQVLINVVKNAIEAMEGGGELCLETRLRGEKVEITISDTGPGIPPEDLERIFEAFYTTKPHGTGLGLGISKSIVEEHPGGSFSVESERGKGTRFKISLPVIQGAD